MTRHRRVPLFSTSKPIRRMSISKLWKDPSLLLITELRGNSKFSQVKPKVDPSVPMHRSILKARRKRLVFTRPSAAGGSGLRGKGGPKTPGREPTAGLEYVLLPQPPSHRPRPQGSLWSRPRASAQIQVRQESGAASGVPSLARRVLHAAPNR